MRADTRAWSVRAALACLLLSAAGSSPGQSGSIRWLDDYQEAIREAKQTGKPIFLEFRCAP